MTTLVKKGIKTAIVNAADQEPIAGKFCFGVIDQNTPGLSSNTLQEEQLALDLTLATGQSPRVNPHLLDVRRYHVVQVEPLKLNMSGRNY